MLVTENENEAVIKIVGKKSENKVVLTAVNVGNKESEVFKGFHTQYTGSALNYESTVDGIIFETRYDYYTRCKYEFTFKYVNNGNTSKEYEFLEGENQKYTLNKDSNMTFKIDANYSLFDKVYIDNELVDISNYKVTEGSTIITFNNEFVSKLSVGKHTLKVMFSNGETSTEFSVVKEVVENPKTIDNIEKYIAIGIVAVIGVVGCVLIIKKEK